MKYIGENSILFNWKTQNTQIYFEINLYFMKLNLYAVG